MIANNNRIAWVDVLKFFGIWAIYIGHFGDKGGKLYPFVFAYHVPLFFFAAGFFSPNFLKDPPAYFTKKKTLQLMVPYVFFSIFALIVFTLLNSWEVPQIKSALMSLTLGIRDQIFAGSLWFIPCLYIIVIGDYFIRKLFKRQMLVLAVAIGIFIVTQTVLPNNPAHNPSWFMNVDSALYYYIYYVLGAVLFPFLTKDATGTIHKVANIVLLIGTFIITVITFLQAPYWLFGKITTFTPAIAGFEFSIPIYDVFIAMTIIYFNIFVAKLFAHIPVLGELGRETLVFCGTEDVTKNILSESLAMFNLRLRLFSPLATVIFSLICLLVSKYTLVKFLNMYFPWTVGRPNPTPIKNDDDIH